MEKKRNKGWDNVVPMGERPMEERQKIGAAGGVKSGEVRRRRKTFAEGLKLILAMDVDDPERLAMLRALGLEGTFQDSINIASVQKAQTGDIEAARFVRDTVGEKPRDGLELGNLDDRPFESIDLSKLSDEQLKALAAKRKKGE